MNYLEGVRNRHGWPVVAIGLWLLAAWGLAVLRPLMPLDETRAVAVAWEMHTGGHWIVPHLNGEPYSEKPPLLGWLVNGAWALFGVSEFVTRLVPAAIGAAALLLTWRLSRQIAPAEPGAAHRLAPLVLVSLPLWTWWGSLVEYDLPLTASILAAHTAALAFARGGRMAWMLAAGLALGAGALFKGPVVLAHVLPAWLAWAWWRPAFGPRAGRWWAGVGLAVGIGLAVGFGWALLAAGMGGEAYGDRLFGQTSRRLGDTARHGKPWWWYGPVLLLVLLPWSLRPGVWTRLAGQRSASHRPDEVRPQRYLAVWIGGSLLVLSMAGAKQPHYLVPVLPPIAMAVAFGLARRRHAEMRLDAWLPAGFLLLVAAVIFAGPSICEGRAPAAVCAAMHPYWAAVPAVAAVGLIAAHHRRGHTATPLAFGMVATLVALAAWAWPVTGLQRTNAVGAAIAALQAEGHTVAQLGRYQGQYHFAGRLRKPVPWFETPAGLAAWATSHPDDYVLVYSHIRPDADPAGPELVRPYRGHYVQLWSAHDALQSGAIEDPDHPHVVD